MKSLRSKVGFALSSLAVALVALAALEPVSLGQPRSEADAKEKKSNVIVYGLHSGLSSSVNVEQDGKDPAVRLKMLKPNGIAACLLWPGGESKVPALHAWWDGQGLNPVTYLTFDFKKNEHCATNPYVRLSCRDPYNRRSKERLVTIENYETHDRGNGWISAKVNFKLINPEMLRAAAICIKGTDSANESADCVISHIRLMGGDPFQWSTIKRSCENNPWELKLVSKESSWCSKVLELQALLNSSFEVSRTGKNVI